VEPVTVSAGEPLRPSLIFIVRTLIGKMKSFTVDHWFLVVSWFAAFYLVWCLGGTITELVLHSEWTHGRAREVWQ